MNRRRFLLTSLAGALAGPVGAGAQPVGRVYTIGILSNGSPAAIDDVDKAMRDALIQLGGRGYRVRFDGSSLPRRSL